MALIDNLVAYWKLDEASGAVEDIHGTNDGTNSGATPNVAGKINTAYSFDGTNDKITIPDSSSLSPTSAITISSWSKKDNAGRTEMILGKMDSSTQRTYYVYTSSTVIGWEVSQNGQGTDRQFGDATWTADTNWHHIVFTFDTSTQTPKIYLDNVSLSTTSTGNAAAIFDSTSDVVIGYDVVDAGYWFDGTIDEVAIWSRALTGTEVTELYNSGNGLAYPFTAGTNIKINIGDDWKDVSAIKVNIDDTWKDVTSIKINHGDTWKTVF